MTDIFDEISDGIKITRFDIGDRIDINNIENDGVFEVIAPFRGFAISDRNSIFVVSDIDLVEADKIRNLEIEKKALREKSDMDLKKERENISRSEVVDISIDDIPDKNYFCCCNSDNGCTKKTFSLREHWHWLNESSDGNEIPPGWPSGWKDGICRECGCPLFSDQPSGEQTFSKVQDT